MNIGLHKFKILFVKFGLLFSISLVICFSSQLILTAAESNLETEVDNIVKDLSNDRRCPCQCNHYLPGSDNSPACFGCSVGKAEITYIKESLKAGKKPRDIVIDLTSPIIVNIFSDYTNDDIPDVWKLANDVSNGLGHLRIVLRAPGLTDESRRAIKLAEYARKKGKFREIQNTLINHQGPWDIDTLCGLMSEHGLDKEEILLNFEKVKIEAQVRKDQHHAIENSIQKFPTIVINRQITANSKEAIHQAIQNTLLKNSI